ncbi:OLC1v1018172C1 [Oldenlandia corymbosa var. corymbosa]|uniref:OLC1v1018172C1 n=1 Tax=Oldenlandia corymbosa var. corymbosa TaxID=529605 RepID=A0AAV1EB76_OLDCO|nr:OLC1v1018172C1 [Oldenlandia corymbosa var. corymbosa]
MLQFHLDEAWRVVAGDESTEFERENNRVNKVLEAIYPRESAIPPDPSNGVGLEDSFANDKPPILIPITPIEDEDAPSATDGYLDSGIPMGLPTQTESSLASSSRYAPPAHGGLSSEIIPGVDPAVVSAANAALSAVMSNNNQANLIDRELLIKILSDPKMVEQLVKNHGTASTTTTQSVPATSIHNVPSVSLPLVAPNNSHIASVAPNNTHIASSTTHNMPVTSMQNRLRPITPGINFSEPSPNLVGRAGHVNRPEYVAAPMSTTNSGVAYYPPPGRIGGVPNPQPAAHDIVRPPSQPVTKDINYYKSLIKQHGHGGDGAQETTQYGGSRNNHHLHPQQVREPSPNIVGRSRDLKTKVMKPCIYYNTARGCRNGANCAFQHDDPSAPQRVSGGLPDSQSAKRMKMDREITGT